VTPPHVVNSPREHGRSGVGPGAFVLLRIGLSSAGAPAATTEIAETFEWC
jgi:hypothetical protein